MARACEPCGAHRESASAYGENASGYLFDEVGNLSEVIDPLNGSTTFVYDAENRLETRTLPNGVVTTYMYDARDRPLSVVHRNASGVVLVSRTYVRAPGGEPTRITKEDGSYVEIGYDAALRITSERYYTAAGVLEEELEYTYDADGNRLTKTRNGVVSTYSYAAGSRLVGVSTEGVLEARVTDNGGRETSLVVDGQQLSLTYDSDDHVTRVVDGTATTEFAFDALGRRVGVTTGTSTKRFLIAPNAGAEYESPQAITDAAGGVLASYVFAGETPLARSTSAGIEYYLTDELGSVIGTADASGSLVSTLEYDAFGNELAGAAAQSAPHGDFRLHGMWKDPSGLYYVRARAYDTASGRFTSRDPAKGTVQTPESLHAYSFANANPAFWIDPSGEFFMVGALVSGGRSLATLSVASARAIFFARAVVQAAGLICTASIVGSAIAGATGANVESGPCRVENEILYRSPRGRESAQRLNRKALESEEEMGLHGVSAFNRPPSWAGADFASAPRSLVETRYTVLDTRGAGHRTILLPKPVTPAEAAVFNTLFGR